MISQMQEFSFDFKFNNMQIVRELASSLRVCDMMTELKKFLPDTPKRRIRYLHYHDVPNPLPPDLTIDQVRSAKITVATVVQLQLIVLQRHNIRWHRSFWSDQTIACLRKKQHREFPNTKSIQSSYFVTRGRKVDNTDSVSSMSEHSAVLIPNRRLRFPVKVEDITIDTELREEAKVSDHVGELDRIGNPGPWHLQWDGIVFTNDEYVYSFLFGVPR
jgi:hypothetical protein